MIRNPSGPSLDIVISQRGTGCSSWVLRTPCVVKYPIDHVTACWKENRKDTDRGCRLSGGPTALSGLRLRSFQGGGILALSPEWLGTPAAAPVRMFNCGGGGKHVRGFAHFPVMH